MSAETKDNKMDELGFNKIAAAVLATALGFMFIKEISHSALHVSAPDKPVYTVGPLEVETPGEVIDLPFPQPEWVASMDATKGAKVFKKCTSCHNADQGGANGTGPNLWNVVGAPAGTHAGFGYSGAMTNSGLTWDYETLDAYLTKPTRYLSGTAMNFIGLKKEADRAAVIEYLRQQADAPIAQPTAAAMETTEASLEDTTLIEHAENAIENAGESTGDLLQDAGDALENVAEAVEDGAKDVVEEIKDVVEDVKEKVESDDEQ